MFLEVGTTPLEKKTVFFLTPEASLIYIKMIRFAMNIKDLELNFVRIQFYKPLASKLILNSGRLERRHSTYWLLVSEPGFLKVLGDFGRQFEFMLKLRPGSNIV